MRRFDQIEKMINALVKAFDDKHEENDRAEQAPVSSNISPAEGPINGLRDVLKEALDNLFCRNDFQKGGSFSGIQEQNNTFSTISKGAQVNTSKLFKKMSPR